jgi:hypothetical protein
MKACDFMIAEDLCVGHNLREACEIDGNDVIA